MHSALELWPCALLAVRAASVRYRVETRGKRYLRPRLAVVHRAAALRVDLVDEPALPPYEVARTAPVLAGVDRAHSWDAHNALTELSIVLQPEADVAAHGDCAQPVAERRTPRNRQLRWRSRRRAWRQWRCWGRGCRRRLRCCWWRWRRWRCYRRRERESRRRQRNVAARQNEPHLASASIRSWVSKHKPFTVGAKSNGGATISIVRPYSLPV